MEVVNQKTNIKIYWKIFRGENKVTEDFHSLNTELKIFVVGSGNKYYITPIINRVVEPGYDVIEIEIPSGMLEEGAYDLRAIWWKNKGRNLLTSNRCGIFGITDSAEEAPIEDLVEIKIASYTENFGRDGMSAYETAVMYDLHLGITSEKEWVMQETVRIQNEEARKAAESNRASNESTRVSNENQRIANENERKAAEEERQAAYQSKLGKEDIVQTTGSSTEKVMSQKAVTDALKNAGGGGGSSVTIVNNLTEGGADKALSAEMGKTLSGRIEEVAEQGGGLTEIPDNSITTAKMADKAVTIAKLADEVQEAIESAGGVTIVDSVDKLDPNAPQGSLATVAVNKHETFSIKDSYVKNNSNAKVIKKFPGNVNLDFLTSDEGFDLVLGAPDCNSSEGSVPSSKAVNIYTEFYEEDTGEGFRTIMVYNSEYDEVPLYTSDGTDIELLDKLNEFIKSLGGVVVYGTYWGGDVDNFEFVDTSDEELELAGRVFGDFESVERKTELFIKDVEGWRKINDAKIVDSLDKLDPNAPQGTLATVAINTLREIKWSEIYQPTKEYLSQPFEEIVGKLTRISKFEVTPPASIDIMPSDGDWYMIRFGSEYEGGAFSIARDIVQCMINGFDEDMMWASSEDGVNYNWNVYDEFVQQANKLLSENPMYYIMSSLNDEPTSLPSFLDDILHIYTGEVSTELYIKTDKGWTPYKESDTVYIDYNALDEYDVENLYEDIWYYKIPIDEFPKVSRGVPFDELNKYKHVAFDGYVEPLMNDEGSYYTPQYFYDTNDIWYGKHLDIFVNGEYVYVGDYIEHMVEMPCRIYDNVEFLPSDAREGTVASVLDEKEVEGLAPVSESFVAGGDASRLTIVTPEKVDPTDFNRNSTLGLNFSTYQYDRGFIEVGVFSGKKGIYGTDGYVMPSMLAEYDSDGNLQNVNQSLIDTLLDTVTTYRSISGSDILDKYFFVPKKTTRLFVRNTSGWEQYSELADQSVTTEKVADGAITLDKLSPETCDILNEYKVPIFSSTDFLAPIAPLGSLASIMTKRMDSFSKYLDTTLYYAKVTIPDELPIDLPSGEIARFEVTYGQLLNIIIKVEYSSHYGGYAIMTYTNGSNSGPVAVYASPYKGGKNLNVNVNNSALHPFEGANTGIVAKSVSHPEVLDVFIKPYFRDYILYIKNEAGWEEYDKAIKDKVATLETKVAELEAKIQELLQN